MNREWRWPDDYVSRGDGALRIRSDYVEAFDRMGWTTLEELCDDPRLDVRRRVDLRANARIEIPYGMDATLAYLKTHDEPWQEDAAIVPGAAEGVPPGIAEADAVERCRAAGIPTMGVIAAGAKVDRELRLRRSFFLSAAIPGGVPADDFWKAEPDPEARREALLALADTARVFHAARLFHRDFYWCHFFLRRRAGRLVAHLIDLQRVVSAPAFPWRWRIKDLGQFWFSAPSLSHAERRLWFSRYFGGVRRPSLSDRLLATLAQSRAAFYRFKEGAP
ncbi:MAG TPA: lipopolysaccharide kinase InaA family protein [Planctomycetia bacterium]|nr:lipopolysaccharide kinase InaA family protein [Planctomycetia bacterium]